MIKNDLTGQVFGRLTVVRDDGTRTKYKKVKWLCLCECGIFTHAIAEHLKKGRTRSCGCLNNEVRSKRRTKDLSNYENDNFKVLKKIGSNKQRVDWLCLCKHCGNTTELNSNEIDKTKSCGCLKKGASKAYMASIMDVESLKSTKPTAKSSTGVRGVYYKKNRSSYNVFINIDKKTTYLGTYKDFNEAVKVRKEAEKKHGYK